MKCRFSWLINPGIAWGAGNPMHHILTLEFTLQLTRKQAGVRGSDLPAPAFSQKPEHNFRLSKNVKLFVDGKPY